ncbi:hypothetical protein JCM19275_1716 [Nonlabens ulvanivorans]|uniref:PA14 domain-containing protein n=1 Tax=Nonlabens ulvanivorans TaxID=906888 RepID=A0A081DFG9_NONUL|nr:hypothetical protein [Nonlabens ulvanivorans]GAK77665.1 hypothetical protein JCM19296_3273 [Nonlabens ulvanivorans]GAL75833.1 hypothetical protein JCM19275_1716 [Nonlabens ulvanivorans]
MNKFFIFLIVLTSAFTTAQEIPTTTPRTIEPVPSGTNTSGSMLFPNSTEEKKYVRPIETPTIDLTQKTDLLDPGVRFQGQKFKKDVPPVNFINDTFLGELRTGVEVLSMEIWDPGAQDGDRVRIWLNDEILVTDMHLTNAIQGFYVYLKPGFNKIEIEALNHGHYAPNTSGITVRDEEGNILDQKLAWINPGVKSLLIVIKE